MSPSGGAMTLVDQPITWSPLNRMPASGSAKHRWFEVWPGVCTASNRHLPPAISSPSLHDDIGREVPVAAFLAARLAAPAAGMRPEAVGRRAGRFLQRLRRRRVVAMRVGDEDMGDPLAGEARQQRVDVLGKVGPGIDDRDLALADDIGAGAAERERAGVARDDAPDPRRHRFEPAVFERELAPVGDFDGHRASAPFRILSPSPVRGRGWPPGAARRPGEGAGNQLAGRPLTPTLSPGGEGVTSLHRRRAMRVARRLA